MSDFYNKYPYTDFHELNLDWVIERVKTLTEDWLTTQAEWNDTEEQWQQLHDYVMNYFENLDVQNEINNKINAMIADGSFLEIVTPTINSTVATTTSEWLAEHITPTTPVVDNTLTVSGAAADAKVAGDAIRTVTSAVNNITGNTIHQFTEGGYIALNGSTTDYSVATNANMKYVIIDCDAGDVFTVSGTAGSMDSARLWGFVDSSGNIIDRAARYASETDLLITAPANTDKMIVNLQKTSSGYVYSNELIRKVVSQNVADISAHDSMIKIGLEVVEMRSGYIATSTSPVPSLDPTSSNDYRFAKLQCSEDDKFIISGKGGTGPRLWAFIDENNVVLSSEDAQIQRKNYIITAPANSKWLIINDGNTGQTSFKYSADSVLHHTRINFEPGYINTSGGIYADLSDVTSSIVYNHCVLECEPGDMFKITGVGGSTPRLWCFCSAELDPTTGTSNKIISRASANTSEVDYIIKAPSESAYLIINSATEDACYYVNDTQDAMIKCESDIVIAASNSSEYNKKHADIICDGENDNVIITQAITTLTDGGTVYLLPGDYYVNSFPYNKSAIFIEPVYGHPRTVTIKGIGIENKGYSAAKGVCIHVTDEAMEALDDNETYRVIASTGLKIDSFVGIEPYYNIFNVENLHIYINDASKKIVGIDGTQADSMYLNFVGVYTDDYFNNRYNHTGRPATPATGSIGIISPLNSNTESARLGMDFCSVGGMNIGFKLKGVDHMTMRDCFACRCNYGYVFEGTVSKTMTIINCCDEGNTHLPLFKGSGHLTCIDFNIERFNADYIPYDASGNTELYAVEETPGSWHGFLSYTLQGVNMGMFRFWKTGSGHNFETINLNDDRSGTTVPTHPEYLQRFFDTANNVWKTYNGSSWV